MRAARIGTILTALSLGALVACANQVGSSARSEPSAAHPASPVTAASPAASSAIPPAAEGSLPALRLPGTRSSPAGKYGWEGGLGERAGMHRVIEVREPREATAMVFEVGPECLRSTQTPRVPVRVAALDGVSVEPYEPPVTFGSLSAGTVTRAYALAVGDRTLCVYLTWNDATTAAELDEAVRILDTLEAEPISASRIRLVFTLEDGWDIG
jgi:hypothetical protein